MLAQQVDHSIFGQRCFLQVNSYGSVSFLVSFRYVLRRSARTTRNRQPRSRTLVTYDELSPTDLEIVSGATSREFESRLHRRREQVKCTLLPLDGCHPIW